MRLILGFGTLALAVLASATAAAQTPASSSLTRIRLQGGLTLFASEEGGNVLVVPSDAGLLLVDSDEPRTAPQLRAELATLGSGGVRVVINTHYHWDHAGGTVLFLGDGARIYATPVTRDAWARAEEDRPPELAGAHPTDLVEGPLRLLWGRDTLDVEPVAPSHTSGDLVVWLRSRNAVHLGDLFQFDGYPSIGLPDGGSIDGTVRVLRDVLTRTNDSTLVIPGHGYPAGRTELLAWTDMLDAVAARVQAAVREGRSIEEVVAMRPTAEFDARWGRGYLSPGAFVRRVYRDLTGYYEPAR